MIKMIKRLLSFIIYLVVVIVTGVCVVLIFPIGFIVYGAKFEFVEDLVFKIWDEVFEMINPLKK